MALGFNAHLTAHGFIGAGIHKMYIPPLPPPAPVPHVSLDTLLGLTINAKYSKTVSGPFGFPLIAKDNDSGYMVPHVAVPNVLLPLVISLGSSKVMFGASKVLIDIDGSGKPCGACCNPWVPLSMNQACNDPCNFPGDIVIAPNSVLVGLTPGDIAAGFMAIAIDSALSFALNKIFDKLAGKLVQSIANNFAKEIGREIEELVASKVATQEIESMAKAIAENVKEWPSYNIIKAVVGKVLKKVVKKDVTKGAGDLSEAVGADHPVQQIADSLFGDKPITYSQTPDAAPSGSKTADSITGEDGSNPNIHNAD